MAEGPTSIVDPSSFSLVTDARKQRGDTSLLSHFTVTIAAWIPAGGR